LENLTWCGWSGHKKAIRLIRCRTCKKMFSRRKGTPLFYCKLPPEKALAALEHVKDGCGMRQTARLTKVSRGAVARLVKRAGKHAEALHDELLAFSPQHAGSSIR
jgi:transposase-like protein